MNRVKAVLLDLGNVFITVRPGNFWETLGIFTPAQQAPFDAKVKAASRLFERGEITAPEFFQRLELIFEKNLDAAKIRRAFDAVLVAPIKGMESIVMNTQSRARVVLVSNTNPIHWETCKKNIRALGRLQAHYLSYKIKAMKPDPNFYAYVVKQEKLLPGEMLFVDDVAENVLGAERAGMRGHQFKTAERLRETLSVYGVL